MSAPTRERVRLREEAIKERQRDRGTERQTQSERRKRRKQAATARGETMGGGQCRVPESCCDGENKGRVGRKGKRRREGGGKRGVCMRQKVGHQSHCYNNAVPHTRCHTATHPQNKTPGEGE
eukprot:2695025-Rhodomonas_salina.1